MKSETIRTIRRLNRPLAGGQTVSVRLTPAELERLDRWIAAARPGATRTAAVRQIVDRALAEPSPVDPA